MDLAAESSPAPTWALFLLASPFFDPPAAHIWARTAVLSGMTAAMSGSWANCLDMSTQTPFSSLRAQRLKTLFHLPRTSTRVFLQECEEFLPLMVGNLLARYHTIVANLTGLNSRLRVLVTASASMKRCHQELKTKDFHISAGSGRSRSGCSGGRGGSRCRGSAR